MIPPSFDDLGSKSSVNPMIGEAMEREAYVSMHSGHAVGISPESAGAVAN
jgi:hypothetical protein